MTLCTGLPIRAHSHEEADIHTHCVQLIGTVMQSTHTMNRNKLTVTVFTKRPSITATSVQCQPIIGLAAVALVAV